MSNAADEVARHRANLAAAREAFTPVILAAFAVAFPGISPAAVLWDGVPLEAPPADEPVVVEGTR